jgi:16S rRNA (guanine966-N2)-methyltransferase
MRIVGGALKNRKLKAPLGFRVRPTSEKVREALFDILKNKVEGARFLDLYAGTGAVGIEAASRGAIKVTFVENKNSVIKVLRGNLENCHLLEMASIIHFDVIDTIRSLNNRQRLFDIVFLDPPYEGNSVVDTLVSLAKFPIMEKSTTIVTQSFFKTDIPDMEGLRRTRREKYGETLLTFFEPNA